MPTKIFDNVYAIGNSGTTVYVIQTSDGLLMIDSLGAAQVDTLLLPGFQKLGLDPAQVKIIIAGHGHADHVGGSRYMQEHFGSKVYISAADWNLIENPPAARGRRAGSAAAGVAEARSGPHGRAAGRPRRSESDAGRHPRPHAGVDGFHLSGEGQRPDAYAAVRRNGLTRGLFQTKAWRRTEVGRALQGGDDEGKVDVEIQNHPLMDPIQVKLDKLAARRTGDRIPSSSARRTIRSSST